MNKEEIRGIFKAAYEKTENGKRLIEMVKLAAGQLKTEIAISQTEHAPIDKDELSRFATYALISGFCTYWADEHLIVTWWD